MIPWIVFSLASTRCIAGPLPTRHTALTVGIDSSSRCQSFLAFSKSVVPKRISLTDSTPSGPPFLDRQLPAQLFPIVFRVNERRVVLTEENLRYPISEL